MTRMINVVAIDVLFYFDIWFVVDSVNDFSTVF